LGLVMKWLTTPCLALLVALLVLPASADAASANVTLKLKGSGVIRIDNLATGQGLTCGPNGDTRPDLHAKTGVEVLACAYTTPLSCAGAATDCDVFAKVEARRPKYPNIAINDVELNWRFSGWTTASTVPECPKANGNFDVCTFKIGTCSAEGCVGIPNLLLVADFRDDRDPLALFGCRTATCPNQLPAISTSASGRTMFQARSDEYRIEETTTLECSVDNGGFVPCEPAPPPAVDATFLTPQVSEGSHTLRVRAIDPSGNVGPPSDARSWTQRYPPRARITKDPTGGATNVRTPEFEFDNETGSPASFRCWFDQQTPADCSLGRFAPEVPLVDGPHTFHVTAKRTDVAGVEQVSPTSVDFTIDAVPPVARIDAGPSEGLHTSDITAEFRFSAEPGTIFSCRLDEALTESCNDGLKRYTGLAPGEHRFTLVAQDRAGNPSPALIRTWTVLADADGDRFPSTVDCEDHDPNIHPNAFDVPGDGIDQDCSGADAPNLDLDGDGFPGGVGGTDCDDANPSIKPNAVEIPGNGIDENCDKVDAPNYDKDGDEFLVEPKGKDCDDTDPRIHPGAKDVPQNRVDEDCDGEDGVYDVVGVRFPSAWVPGRRYTTMVSVGVSSLPKDSRIHIRCKGKCPGGTRVLVVRKARARYELRKFLQRRYRIGDRLEVRVTKRKRSPEGSVWTMRSNRAPKQQTFCVFNGKRKKC